MVYFSSLLFHERLWPASTEEKERFWGILSRFYDLVGWKEMRFCKIVRFNPRNRRLNISFWKFMKLFIINKELKLISDYSWIMDHNAPGSKYWNQQGGQHMIAISWNLKGESHHETLMQKKWRLFTFTLSSQMNNVKHQQAGSCAIDSTSRNNGVEIRGALE